jgi:hypothetical protein
VDLQWLAWSGLRLDGAPVTITPQQVTAALEILASLAQVIKTKGSVPDGELYAAVMGTLSLNSYNTAIEKLISARLVERKNHLLTWIG